MSRSSFINATENAHNGDPVTLEPVIHLDSNKSDM